MKLYFKFPYLSLIGLLLGAFLFASCNNDDDETVDDIGPLAPITFGATYTIDFTASGPPPLNLQLPYIAGDSLFISAAYSGCSDDHTFEMRYRLLSARRAEVWLHKITPDEACQAAFSSRLTFAVPAAVLVRDRIELIAPGAVTYSLR